MSKLNEILDAIVLDHQAAALTIGGQALTIVKRKLPKKEETVDASYQVTIAGESDKMTRIAFGSRWQVEYIVSMTCITPNKRDGLLNLQDHTDWRETTRARYMKPNPIPDVKRVEIIQTPILDRAQLASGYDYDTVTLLITTYEIRT